MWTEDCWTLLELKYVIRFPSLVLPFSHPLLLGFWPSSMRISFPNLRMCQHQRPITAWNNRGPSSEGDDGVVSFPCRLYPDFPLQLVWPVLMHRGVTAAFSGLLCFSGLSSLLFWHNVCLLPLPGGTSCFYHATNLHPYPVCGAVLHVKPPPAALLQCTVPRQACGIPCVDSFL